MLTFVKSYFNIAINNAENLFLTADDHRPFEIESFKN